MIESTMLRRFCSSEIGALWPNCFKIMNVAGRSGCACTLDGKGSIARVISLCSSRLARRLVVGVAIVRGDGLRDPRG